MGNKPTHEKEFDGLNDKKEIDYDSALRLVFTATYKEKFSNDEKEAQKQIETLKSLLSDLDEVVVPLFCYLSHCTSHSLQYMTKNMFLTGAMDLSRHADADHYSAEVDQYFTIFSERQDFLIRTPAMWISCYKASLITAGLKDELPAAPHDPIFTSILKSLFGHKEQVMTADHVAWCKQNCRGIIQDADLKNLLVEVLSNSRIKAEEQQPNNQDDDSCSEYSNKTALAARTYLLTPPLLWATIMCTAREQYLFPEYGSESPFRSVVHGAWTPLYSSKIHGLSVSGFKRYVYDYNGATLLVLQFDNMMYCLGSNIRWSDNSTKWRGDECIVFTLLQEFKTVTRDSNMVYFNLDDHSAPKGLQIGKYGGGRPLVCVDANFTEARHYGIASRLEGVEVWGCGSQSVREHQLKQQEWNDKEANKNKNRKLKLDDWENSPDRQLLELGGVQTEHAER